MPIVVLGAPGEGDYGLNSIVKVPVTVIFQ
jgi:hypothetical protein